MTKTTIIIFILTLLIGLKALAADDPDSLYKQGKYEEAQKAYSNLDMDNPKDIRFRFNRGCAAFQNSDFKTAAASFSSVLRRTENKDVKFKAAYNLGNTAFKQGDYKSAAEYYKQAINYNPANPDSRYNLELSLREIEKRKKKEQEKQQKEKEQKEKEQQNSGNQEGEENKQDSGDKNKEPDKKSGDRNKAENKEQDGKNHKDTDGGKGRQPEQKEPKDLSGDLKATGNMPEQKEERTQEQAGSSLDKKRAEAILDNLKEDRSKFLRFQVPEDKQEGVRSGKDW